MNSPDLDIKHLLVFQALMSKRQVSLVAEDLGQSQPGVSRSLAKLRKHFGDPLFVRAQNEMKPTPCAREIAPGIDEMLDLYYSLLSQKQDFDPMRSRRTFRIAASEIGHSLLFPRLIADFGSFNSLIRLKAVPLGLHSLRDELETGETDVAVGAFPKLYAGVHERRLFTEHYVCLVRGDHPSVGNAISAQQFTDAEHIVVSARGLGHEHEQIEKALYSVCPQDRVRAVSHSFLVAAMLVERSDCVATVPSRIMDILGPSHNLRVLPVPIELPSFEAKLYWHERFHREPANRWIRTVIADYFKI